MKLKLFETVSKAKVSTKTILVGRISNTQTAEAIVREMARVLFILSMFQAVMGLMLFKVGGYALLIDAIVFFIFGFLLIRTLSRIIALILLALAIFILITTLSSLIYNGIFGVGTNLILSLIVLFVAIRSTQSTFYCHRQQK